MTDTTSAATASWVRRTCGKPSFPERTAQILRETQRTELERHLFVASEITGEEGKKHTKGKQRSIGASKDARDVVREEGPIKIL